MMKFNTPPSAAQVKAFNTWLGTLTDMERSNIGALIHLPKAGQIIDALESGRYKRMYAIGLRLFLCHPWDREFLIESAKELDLVELTELDQHTAETGVPEE